MGGAKRAERQRRQRAVQAAKQAGKSGAAKRAARPAGKSGAAKRATPPAGKSGAAGRSGRFDGNRRRIAVALVVVVLLVAAVAAGVLWQRSRSGPDPAQAVPVTAEYPVALTDGVVVAGKDSAGVTVEIYEDFLCPTCREFEERDAAAIENALAAGTVRVRYHMVNILDNRSNPPGYSTDAANAALCAADAGKFPGYHASLFGSQPREGGRGYTDDQLVQLGRDLDITGAGFESCVRTGAHDADVHAQEQAASSSEALRGRRGFGTPTVVVDGKLVDISSPSWLTDAIAAAG